MSAVTGLLIFGFSFLSALTVLTFLSSFKVMEKLFFRTIAGGTVGGFSASYLTSVKPTLSFIETSVNGDFGIGGYVMILSLIFMLFIWGYNLFRYGAVAQ